MMNREYFFFAQFILVKEMERKKKKFLSDRGKKCGPTYGFKNTVFVISAASVFPFSFSFLMNFLIDVTEKRMFLNFIIFPGLCGIMDIDSSTRIPVRWRQYL